MNKQSTLVNCLSILILAFSVPVYAEQVTVAVASNFVKPLEALKPVYETSSGHTLVISGGSTGRLYAQIKNGAPFDVLLSADEERPRLIEQEGLGVTGTRFTYAIGKLVLWGPGLASMGFSATSTLGDMEFRALALANPALAPYGMAAKQALERLHLWELLQNRIVLGQDIGQTFSMIHTGNAELGFVALSQLLDPQIVNADKHWEVPARLHDPILQQAILLMRGKDNPAAKEFITFLKSEAGRKIITEFGYATE